MSIILLVTVLLTAGIEHALPPWALLALTTVTLPPAVAVDVLVFVGPRKRPFRDPLAWHPENGNPEDLRDMNPHSDEPH